VSAPPHPLLDAVRRVHEEIRYHVVAACERAAAEELAEVARDEEGDTLYAIDRVAEERLIALFERALAPHGPALLVAEGLSADGVVLPAGRSASDAVWRVIVDPIDGTRGLMYQKRSAWILTGIARNRGPQTGLQDIELAVQTEIPVVKQHESDSLWAARGSGAAADRFDRRTG
jgi:fructose-1,6-bisphosphatase/inositol monophosphatase family enzyme